MICPICKNEIKGYPALDRNDNKTEICSDCGIKQAINDLLQHQELERKAKQMTKI